MAGRPAARLFDFHFCPARTGKRWHVGGPIVSAEPTVLVAHRPAARLADSAICRGPMDRIVAGSAGVMVGYRPAARLADRCAHGGFIVQGAATVLIG